MYHCIHKVMIIIMMTGLFYMMISIKIYDIKEKHVIKELCKTEFKYVNNYVNTTLRRELVKEYCPNEFLTKLKNINEFKNYKIKENK